MSQIIHPAKGPIHARIEMPGALSISFRALLLAALADGVSEISSLHINHEIKTLTTLLNQLGIVIQLDEAGSSCIVAGGNGIFPKKEARLWCADAKIVAHFLLAACAPSPGVYFFDGSKRLREKSFHPLLTILCRQGAQLIPNDQYRLPVTLVGADTLEGGDVFLDHSVTSLLISSLLMIAPFARAPFNYTVVDLACEPYIDMTCAMMGEFGVLVHRVHQGQFMIPVPQRYQARDYTVPRDLALASYFFAAAAITNGEITIPDMKRDHAKQSQVVIFSLLEKMGCRFHETASGITIKGTNELKGIEMSLHQFSDLFTLFAAIAPFAKTPTTIKHTNIIQPKERKRINLMKQYLIQMGIQVESDNDWVKIYPGKPNPCIIDSKNDRRIAMAFALVGLKVPGITIQHTRCLTKTYPQFFSLWEKMAEQESACA